MNGSNMNGRKAVTAVPFKDGMGTVNQTIQMMM
jgi:hypothetical protein